MKNNKKINIEQLLSEESEGDPNDSIAKRFANLTKTKIDAILRKFGIPTKAVDSVRRLIRNIEPNVLKKIKAEYEKNREAIEQGKAATLSNRNELNLFKQSATQTADAEKIKKLLGTTENPGSQAPSSSSPGGESNAATSSSQPLNLREFNSKRTIYYKKGKGIKMKKVLKENDSATNQPSAGVKALKNALGLGQAAIPAIEGFLNTLVELAETNQIGNLVNALKAVSKAPEGSPERKAAEEKLNQMVKSKAATAAKSLATETLSEAQRRNASFVSYLFEAGEHETEEHEEEQEKEKKEKEEKHKKALEASKKAAERLMSDLKNKKELAKEVMTAEDAMKVLKKLVQSFNLDEEAAEELAKHLHDLV